MIAPLHLFIANAATPGFDPPTAMNQFNSTIIGWLVVSALLVMNFLVGLKTLRRTPSLETEITQLKSAASDAKQILENVPALKLEIVQLKAAATDAKETLGEVQTLHVTLDAVKESLGGVHQRLALGDEQITLLREKQAVNAEAIQTMKNTVQEINVQVLQIARDTCNTGGRKHS